MINVELERLYEQDRQQRLALDKGLFTSKQLETNDIQRLQRVKQLLPVIDLNEIWNCHYSALILLHSTNPKDFETAHKLAKRAVSMGSKVSLWLYAASLDRMLISQQKPQKFGTQFQYDKKSKRYKQLPIDSRTTDSTRAKYGVPTLFELRSRWKSRNLTAQNKNRRSEKSAAKQVCDEKLGS